MDDQRNSSSPEMGFARYGAYNIQGEPSDIPLPFSPPFPAQQPQYLTPTVPIFEDGFAPLHRSSQISVDTPGHFLQPRAPQDRAHQNDYEMTHRHEEFAEDEAPEPLVVRRELLADPMENASEFVKKLFKALEDPIFQPVMCWGPLGEWFMIKDAEEFTKTVLPRLYKHSNFASFVRQLNKYDFHKLKNVDENESGDQHWCFKHSNFHANRPEDLENVKRKPTVHQHQRSGHQSSPETSFGSFPSTSNDSSASPVRTTSTSHSNYSTSPYLQSSNSSFNDHSNSDRRKAGKARFLSQSPSRAKLYTEIQGLKKETEDSKVKMRDLDRTSETMRLKMQHIQKLLDNQGEVLRLLASQYLPTNEAKRAGLLVLNMFLPSIPT